MKVLLYCVLTSLFFVGSAMSGGEDAALAGRVLDLLDSCGVDYDVGAAQRAAAVAILKEVDSRSLLLAAGADRRLTATNGIVCASLWSNGLGYVRMSGLQASTGTQVVQRVREWATNGLDGVILDIRQAEGNSEVAIADLAGLFLPSGTGLLSIACSRGSSNDVVQILSRGSGCPVSPILLLVDSGTAGAAEGLAAAAKGRAGVMLVGENTSGDAHLRSYVEGYDDVVVYLATRRLVAVNGESFGGVGVRPDVVVTRQSGVSPESVILPAADLLKAFGSVTGTKDFLAGLAGDPALGRGADILLGLRALTDWHKDPAAIATPEVVEELLPPDFPEN